MQCGCRRQLLWIGVLTLGILAFIRGLMEPGATSSAAWLVTGIVVMGVAAVALGWRAFSSIFHDDL